MALWALFLLASVLLLPSAPTMTGVLAQAQATPTPPRYLLDVPPYLDGVVTCIPLGATVEMHVLPLNPSQTIIRCVVVGGTPFPTPIDTVTNTPLTPTPTVTSTPLASDTPTATFTPIIPTLTETPVGASPAPTTVPAATDTPTLIPTATVSVPTSGTPTPTATPTIAPPMVVVNASEVHQTMLGWQSTGVGPVDDGNYATYRDALFASAEDLGINSVRLEVRKLLGQPSFDLADIDNNIDKGLLAYRTLLASHGKRLVIDLCVSGGGFSFKTYGAGNAAAFASAMAALYLHMQSRYGFVPDYLEILEPDTFGWYTNLGSPVGPNSIGDIYAQTGDALISAGFSPQIIATSDSRTDIFLLRFPQLWNDVNHPSDRMKNRANIKVASFHLYDNAGDAALANIAGLGTADNLPTAMLEHIGSTYLELHRLLKTANVSLYQQYTLAFPTTDNGAQYFVPNGITYTMGFRTKPLYQYMHYVAPGAVRIGAAGLGGLDAVAFINPNGQYVVVIPSVRGDFAIAGLPQGTYGLTYTGGSAFNVAGLDTINLATSQPINFTVPITSTVTVWGK